MKEQLKLRSIRFSNDVLLGSVVDMVKSGSIVKINITGSSMEPFLYDGESILLKKIFKKEINLGDIILGKYRGKYVLHRVVRRKHGCVFLAGDNNLGQIEKIEDKDICAIATAIVREESEKDLTTIFSRYIGLLWFYLRPIRKVYFKIFN